MFEGAAFSTAAIASASSREMPRASCTRSYRLARSIPKRDGRSELHGQAIILGQRMRHLAHRDLDTAFAHPNLLMDARLARAGLIRHARAGGQHDLDDLDG